ncbi:hypothetical protein M9H77_04625 [Catharanthus roseus]|uniref:Uncharacterized protein n=1 Tax=Catharanthus roseus TaxID=4058 RepID=A0ACC0CEY2_CATRO|nr:hypothetical protein M9H77_04625 [Catharanthus roseus]
MEKEVKRKQGWMTMTNTMKKKYHGRHSHKIGVYPHAHAQAARLTNDQLKLTEEFSRCQVAPRNIMAINKLYIMSGKDEEKEDGGTYNMPLLEAVGMTLTGKIFTVATTFIQNEKAETYEWCYNSLRIYISNLSSLPLKTTNRAVSENSMLKAWIATRHNDLDTVFLKIDYLIEDRLLRLRPPLNILD